MVVGTLAAAERGQDDDERGDLLGSRMPRDDAQGGVVRSGVVSRVGAAGRGARRPILGRAHSGMFPCFFGGSVSRLFRSARSARVTFMRVFDGLMTVSM